MKHWLILTIVIYLKLKNNSILVYCLPEDYDIDLSSIINTQQIGNCKPY
jgi:hypothetical protein